MRVNLNGLARIVARVLWADKKVMEEEWSAAEGIFKRYDIPWKDAKKKIESYLEDFLGMGKEDEEFIEAEEDFGIESVYLGEIDEFDLLSDLALLIVSDKEISFTEIKALHRIADAINIPKEFATAAILNASRKIDAGITWD